jgi:TRAP-type uncharacterized transport system substrate-binding protein
MGNNVKMLEFTDEQIEQADGGLELWTRYVINEGTYPGQARDIATIAQPNFLGVRADVDEEAVYLITKTIYENLPFSTPFTRQPRSWHWKRPWPACPCRCTPVPPGFIRKRA